MSFPERSVRGRQHPRGGLYLLAVRIETVGERGPPRRISPPVHSPQDRGADAAPLACLIPGRVGDQPT